MYQPGKALINKASSENACVHFH